MLTLRATGTAAAVEPGMVELEVPHYDGPPVRLRVKTRGALSSWCCDSLRAGDLCLAIGYGYQRRSPNGPQLWMEADAVVARPELGQTIADTMTIATNGVLVDDPSLGVAESGPRRGDEVGRFTVHARSPHRDGPTVLRCKVWGRAAHWIAKRHKGGDRINVEGTMREVRWTDGGGEPRRAHEIIVRRWHYAKAPPEARR